MSNKNVQYTPKSAMISCGLTLACIVLATCAAMYIAPFVGDIIVAYYRFAKHITEIERFIFAAPMFLLLWGHCVSFKLEDSDCQNFKLSLCIVNAFIWNVTTMLYACYIMTVEKQSGIIYGWVGEFFLTVALFFSFLFIVFDARDQIKSLNSKNKSACTN